MLVGPRGSTLSAVQDLTRAVVQRQCPSRTDRILVDVAGYRERRSAALKRFSIQIAEEVLASGQEKALEAMSPADRKAVHDAVNEMPGGRDPLRGRGPQPLHRHRAGGLTPRRCLAPTTGVAPPPRCTDVLAEARGAGFLGPGPLEPQIRHAEGFATVARRLAAEGPSDAPRGRSGLGRWPSRPGRGRDAGPRRIWSCSTPARRRAGLPAAGGGPSGALGPGDGPPGAGRGLRAPGRLPWRLRRRAGAVLRASGRGGRVCRAAPPGRGLAASSRSRPPRVGSPGADEEARWPVEPLHLLGLEPVELVHEAFDYRVLRQTAACPDAFPAVTGSRRRSRCSRSPRTVARRTPVPGGALFHVKQILDNNCDCRPIQRFHVKHAQLLTSGRRQARIVAVQRQLGGPV